MDRALEENLASLNSFSAGAKPKEEAPLLPESDSKDPAADAFFNPLGLLPAAQANLRKKGMHIPGVLKSGAPVDHSRFRELCEAADVGESECDTRQQRSDTP